MEANALAFEKKPSYPLQLSLVGLQGDLVYESILKINQKVKTNIKPVLLIADSISEDRLSADIPLRP
jgi:hypothetical protein